MIYEPRLRLDDTHADRALVDCMICGKSGPRSKMCSNSEGAFPELHFHAACGTGRTGEQIHRIYTESIHAMFRRGEKPLTFD